MFEPRPLITIAAAIVLATAAVAVTSWLAFRPEARGWLGFDFGGVPPNVGSAVGIFLNNSRLVILAALAAAIAQARLGDLPSPRLSLSAGALAWLARACACALTLVALMNVTIVGLAVGAYGLRMCVALLPHGPLEVGAYCVALRFYLVARQRPLAAKAWISTSAVTVALLAIAALLETFAWLG